MKVLIACEYSAIVRSAFMRKGHNAWSCDIEDTDVPGQHIKGDVLTVINDGWDLIIAHPPCTYLAKAGLHLLNGNPERQQKQRNAIEFVKAIYNANAPYIAIENPIGALTDKWQRPAQIVYPWYWGEPYGKDICFWLKNLAPLKYDYSIQKPARLKSVSNHVNSRMSQEQKRKIKSRFFHSVAEQMAEQWGNLPSIVPSSSVDSPQDVPGTSGGLCRPPDVRSMSPVCPLNVPGNYKKINYANK